MNDREQALGRLGVPRCANCDAIGEGQARLRGHVAKGDTPVTRDCCSATCAVAVLDTMYSGTANIVNMKRRGVIALKRGGQKTGLWPRGRKRLAIEARKAARSA